MRKHWGAQTKLPSFNGAWHEGWDLSWGATSHAWSSGPTALLIEKVLGIEPTGYGWKTFNVKPHLGDLTWANGKVATVAGEIIASWKKLSEQKFNLNINVPARTSAKVYLPTINQQSITVNGKAVSESTYELHQEDGKWCVLTVGPGRYDFRLKRE
jgi:hypothetical protein